MLGSSKNKASPKCLWTSEHKFDNPGLQIYFYVLTHHLESDNIRRLGNAFSAPWQAEGKFQWGSTGLIQRNGEVRQACLQNKTLLNNVRMSTVEASAKHKLTALPCPALETTLSIHLFECGTASHAPAPLLEADLRKSAFQNNTVGCDDLELH